MQVAVFLKHLQRVTQFAIGLTLGGALIACQPGDRESSGLDDIYTGDASSSPLGNSRRHSANMMEAIWTVEANGCSGTLLTPQHVLLAAHCQAAANDTFTSGLAVLAKSRPDLRVTGVLEESRVLDYAIVGVTWIAPAHPQQQYPARVAIEPGEVFLSPLPQQGDPLFTVGFPDDKTDIWPVTYAEGQAKLVQGERFAFNIGIINGNSGGGVLKKENQMLVAIATSGRKNYGDPGWDRNNPDDPQNWNSGTPTWAIYSQSKLLPQLFPNGKRRDLTNALPAKTQIFVAVDGSQGLPRLWVSANHESSQILMCEGNRSVCKAGEAGTETLVFRDQKSERKLYQTSQNLSDRARTYLIQAFDSKGQILGSRSLQIQKRGTP